DLDAWPEALDVGVIRSITTDHSQCLGRRCPHITGCSFFRAREGLEETDIIVTNHDLVLADFRLGGGRILSEPEESYYIFDEGHQLAEKCLEHFACFSRSGRTCNNLAETQQWLDAKRELLIEYEVRPEALSALSISTDDLIQASRDTYALCWTALSGRVDDRADLRFPFGVVDEELRDASRALRDLWRLHRQKLSPVLSLIEALVEEDDADQREIWESNLNDLQVILARAEGQIALWDSYASSDEESSTPWARWMRHYGDESSIECYASPIYARDILSEHVWERVAGAVMTSATLTALGSFDHLMQQTGLPSDTKLARVESPFEASRGRFVVPDMATDPSEPAAHSDELINLFPSLLERHRGTLVLFSSKRQLQELVEALEPTYESRLLVQGQMSKADILQEHRRRIDRGDSSIIFGLASFAEGVDLPGDYCSHVIIAKLPFAAPDDPIDAAHAELLKAAGRNPFMELTVPSASLRLLQACGRLLRTETDEGVITLLDRRIITKRYGRAIMDALPRYQFEVQ
ncbi:MAG: helicase C-terminal domain-containing protein, partial [Pseudomonadota bacterium]|nr:helicase C-terminal domain-containing protein [Pseudomonadota bacterium]